MEQIIMVYHLYAAMSVIIAGGVVGQDMYIASDAAGTLITSGQTSITNTSTALAYPLITITGTTTAAETSTLQWLENQTTRQVLYFNLTIQSGETITIDFTPGNKSVTSSWRGRINDNPLSNSDFANWKIIPGTNTVAAFITGTTTGVTMTARWTVTHNTIDGATT
jgi:phage-related protein